MDANIKNEGENAKFSQDEFTEKSKVSQLQEAVKENLKGIKSQATAPPPPPAPAQHDEMLKKLLDDIPTDVDFRTLANTDNNPDFKLKTKHYLIIAVEKILSVAKNKNWGLCKNDNFIYLYNGAYWKSIEKETFENFLVNSAERMGVDKYSAKYHVFQDQIYKQFLSQAFLERPKPNLNEVLINLKNGTFTIKPDSQQMRIKFEASDFLTYQLGFEYDKGAKAPIFQKYLDRVLPPDKDTGATATQKVLAEYIGYLFIKHGSNVLKAEKALMLYGTGANGKSVFFEVINALLGEENISNYSLSSITNENSYSRINLANKLVNYASEISGKVEAEIFKQLVSGEPVEARHLYSQSISMKQYAKLIFNCNELPKDVEHTHAYFRRFLIIPFDVTIPEAEQDKNLHTKIIESELSGVFNWVLEGLNRLMKQRKFTECKEAENALNLYKKESDSVQMYLEENCYCVSTNSQMALKDMFSEYKMYCLDSNFRPLNIKKFADRLRKNKYETQRQNYGNVVFAKKTNCEENTSGVASAESAA